MAEPTETILIKVELQGVDKSKKDLQALKDASERLALETKELQNELKKVGKENESNSKVFKELSAQIEANQTKLKQNRREQLEYSIAIRSVAQAQKEASQAAKESAKQAVAEEGSLNALRKRLSEVVKERNAINRATVEGAKRYAELTAQAKSLTDTLKKEESAIGDNRRNVGNYTEAIKDALGAQGGFIGQLQAMQATLITLKQAVGGLTGSLNGVKGVLAGGFIGTAIVALGLLIKAFTASKDGADSLATSLTAIETGFSNFISSIELIRTKYAPSLSSSLSGIGKILEGLWDLGSPTRFGEGLEKIKQGYLQVSEASKELQKIPEDLSEAGKAAAKATADAKLLADALIIVKDARIQLEITNIQALENLEKLKKTGDDVSQSEEKRVNARREGVAILKKVIGEEIKLLEDEYKATVELNNLSANVEKGGKKQTAQLEEEKNILVQISSARSRLSQEIQDAVNAEANIEREAFNAKLGRLRALETAEQNLLALTSKGKEDAIKREIDNSNLLLDNDKLTEQEQIALLKERGIQEAALLTQQLSNQELLLNAKIEALEKESQLQEEYTKKNVLFSQEETDTRLSQVKLLEEQIRQLRESAGVQYVAIAKKSQKEVVETEKQTAEVTNDIQKQKFDYQLGIASQLAGGLAAISQDSFELNKAFQLAGAAIDGYKAVTAAISSTANAGLGIGSQIAAGVAAGLFALAQIVKIQQTQAPTSGGGGSSFSASSTAVNSRTSSATLANGASQPSLQANQLANTLRNQPAPIVRVADINNAQSRVSVKDSVRKL